MTTTEQDTEETKAVVPACQEEADDQEEPTLPGAAASSRGAPSAPCSHTFKGTGRCAHCHEPELDILRREYASALRTIHEQSQELAQARALLERIAADPDPLVDNWTEEVVSRAPAQTAPPNANSIVECGGPPVCEQCLTDPCECGADAPVQPAEPSGDVQPTEEEQEWFLGNGYGSKAGPAQVRHLVEQTLAIAPLLLRAGVAIVRAPAQTPVLPAGWVRVGAVIHNPEENPEKAFNVRWWGAHHDGLYVEGYDFAVVVPRAVILSLMGAPAQTAEPAWPTAEEVTAKALAAGNFIPQAEARRVEIEQATALFDRLNAAMRESDEWGTGADMLRSLEERGLAVTMGAPFPTTVAKLQSAEATLAAVEKRLERAPETGDDFAWEHDDLTRLAEAVIDVRDLLRARNGGGQ